MPAAAHNLPGDDAGGSRVAAPGWLGRAALVTLAWAYVFYPALAGGWLWDDDREVAANELLRDGRGLWEIWFAPGGVDYFPLKSTVQWVLWHLGRGEPAVYHCTSAALHLLAAFLLWRVLARLGVRQAWLGGLLLVVHPLVVESVAWAAELKNTLSLPLGLLAFAAWLDFDERGRPRAYALALLGFAAAMLSKSSVVMLPVVLLLHAWWKRGRVARADVLRSLPFFAISLALGAVTWWFQQQRAIGETAVAPAGGLLERLGDAGLAIWFYAAKAVLPVGLLPVYPPWRIYAWAPAAEVLAWPALAAAFGLLWARRASWGRHALFGGGVFVLNLLPVLGIITMSYMTYAPVADHFVYLPLTGLLGLAAAGAGALWEKLRARARPWAIAAAAALALALAQQSRAYAEVFHDPVSLWTRTLRGNPAAWVAHYDLGVALLEQGRAGAAARHFALALQTGPNLAKAHNNLGLALERVGHPAAAAAQYREALRLDANFAAAAVNLGNVCWSQRDAPGAVRDYRRALRADPTSAQAHYDLAAVLLAQGQTLDAAEHLTLAAGFAPGNAAVRLAFGNVLLQLGRDDEAVREFTAAIQLEPALATAHNNLAAALARLGRADAAAREYQAAQQLRPNSPAPPANPPAPAGTKPRGD